MFTGVDETQLSKGQLWSTLVWCCGPSYFTAMCAKHTVTFACSLFEYALSEHE